LKGVTAVTGDGWFAAGQGTLSNVEAVAIKGRQLIIYSVMEKAIGGQYSNAVPQKMQNKNPIDIYSALSSWFAVHSATIHHQQG